MSERLYSRASWVLAPWQARSVHSQHFLLGGGRTIKVAKGAVWDRPRQAAQPLHSGARLHRGGPANDGERQSRPRAPAEQSPGSDGHICPYRHFALTSASLEPTEGSGWRGAGREWWIQREQGFLVMLITLGFTLLQATGPSQAPGLGLAVLEVEGDGAVVLGQSFGGEERQQSKGAQGEDWQAVWGRRRGCLKPLLGATGWGCCPAAAREGCVRAGEAGRAGRGGSALEPWHR